MVFFIIETFHVATVDLPGFTKTPVVSQNEDIEEQILELNLDYTEDDNTVILSVRLGFAFETWIRTSMFGCGWGVIFPSKSFVMPVLSLQPEFELPMYPETG